MKNKSTFDKVREALKKSEMRKIYNDLVVCSLPDRNKLRPYQLDALDRFADGVSIELPAGSGKSAIFKAYLENFKSQGHKIIVCHRGKKRLRKRKIISRPYQDEMAKRLDNFHGHVTNGGKTVLVFSTGRGCGKSDFIKRLENL